MAMVQLGLYSLDQASIHVAKPSNHMAWLESPWDFSNFNGEAENKLVCQVLQPNRLIFIENPNREN